MSNKTFSIDYNGETEVKIEVDTEIFTEEKQHLINNFWSGSEDRIRDSKNVLHAVLKMLAVKLIQIEISGAYPLIGIEHDFDFNNGRGHEGWPLMDGSEGIKIISVDEHIFDECDLDITEV